MSVASLEALGVKVVPGSVPLTSAEEQLLESFGRFCHSVEDYVPWLWKRAEGNWARRLPSCSGYFPNQSYAGVEPLDLAQLLDQLTDSRTSDMRRAWEVWKRMQND